MYFPKCVRYISLSVLWCRCVSLSVLWCRCVSLSVLCCRRVSLSGLWCRCISLSVLWYRCVSLSVSCGGVLQKLQLQTFMLYAHGPDLCLASSLRHARANCFEALMGASLSLCQPNVTNIPAREQFLSLCFCGAFIACDCLLVEWPSGACRQKTVITWNKVLMCARIHAYPYEVLSSSFFHTWTNCFKSYVYKLSVWAHKITFKFQPNMYMYIDGETLFYILEASNYVNYKLSSRVRCRRYIIAVYWNYYNIIWVFRRVF